MGELAAIRMRSTIQDLVVAGGGIAGLALALTVKRRLPAAAIALFDPQVAARRQSFRAVAVAAGSRRFLDNLGVWDAVAARAQPIAEMIITDSRVEEAPRPVYLDFAGEAAPGEPFAHMVLHDDLRTALLRACETAGLDVADAGVAGFEPGRSALALTTGAGPVRTRLLVAADGARSRLRDLAGIGTVGWDYGQAGIVATVSHDVPHRGRAIQHFLPGGPLAILPLRAENGSEQRFSLVWTEGLAAARRLVELPSSDFLAALEAAIGHEHGTLALEDRPVAHALRLILPRRLVAGRFALLGDAARAIHPLAGQGLNLGLRDAAVMAELVEDRLSLGLDPGSSDSLEAYQRARRFDGVMMAAATDGLNRLFSVDALPVRLLRDFGLGLVDRMPQLKQVFMREAAGLAGPLPRAFTARDRAR